MFFSATKSKTILINSSLKAADSISSGTINFVRKILRSCYAYSILAIDPFTTTSN
jgi:hypothetical protein